MRVGLPRANIFTASPFDAASLAQRIDLKIVAKHAPQPVALEALSAVAQLAKDGSKQAPELLQTVLKNIKVDNDTLRKFFLTTPPPSSEASIKAIEAFNKQNPKGFIPESVAMIPYRRATYKCDFDNALRLLDLTAGVKSHADILGQRKIYKAVGLWSLGVGSILGGVDTLLSSGLVGTWHNKGMVLSMVFTYLCAVSVYGTMAFTSSRSTAGEVLRWTKGTFFTTRFKRGLQLKLASLVAEMNRSLPENQGDCATHMLKELEKRHLEVIESPQELMTKEYWARGGEGFEWVEPDQDPADQIWRAKMEASRQKRIGSPYVRRDEHGKTHEWAQAIANEADGRTVPHASLIDITKLSPNERIELLEQEMRSIREAKPEAELPPADSDVPTQPSDKDSAGKSDKDSKQ